jgi:acyl-CoA synthetase (AMP-forming)/AMP-acid ligase II
MLPPADQMLASPPVFLGLVPFYHAYGLMGLVNYCLAAGGKVVVLEKFKPRLFLEAIETYKVRGFQGMWFVAGGFDVGHIRMCIMLK